MAPNSNVILCRHAQAEHNVEYDYTIPDAVLTTLGRTQASAIGPLTKDLQDKVDLVVTSPLKRTLQTTVLGWEPAIDRLGIHNVICLPQAQECNAFACDTGSSREVLESTPEFQGFNFELLEPEWTSKQGFYAAQPNALTNRARWVRQFLLKRPERNIVLVAHGDILRQITASPDGPGTIRWYNAEVRSFKFDPKYVDTPECWLYQEDNIAVVGGYAPNSSDMISYNL